jgi:Domain of unknown function (DUF4873)
MTSYVGSVIAGDRVVPVEVELSVRFEPVDGQYHWGGRIAPNPEVAALVRGGTRTCELRIETTARARLGELDPWGGIRISGTGPPPLLATTSPK